MLDPPDGLLEELRSAGRVESSASFTVDRERAASLLARLRFQSPYEYILKLVQHAVAAGAGQVWVTVLGRSVSVWYDEAVLTERDLAELPRFALEPKRSGPDRHLTHLAEGLQAATALRPSLAEVAVVTRTEGVRLVHDHEGERLERLWKPQEGPWTRIRLRGLRAPLRSPDVPPWVSLIAHLDRRSLGDLFAELVTWRDSEYSQVWRRCLFAPVPVLLNRRVVNRPHFGVPSSVTQRKGTDLLISPAAVGAHGSRYLVAPAASPACLPAPSLLPQEDTAHRLCWKLPSSSEGWETMKRSQMVTSVALGTLMGATVEDVHGVDPPGSAFGGLHLWGQPCLPAHAVLSRGSAPGWLALVRDGVVLERLEPPLSGWRIACRADGLDLDLSGLRVVKNEGFEEVLACLAAATRLPPDVA